MSKEIEKDDAAAVPEFKPQKLIYINRSFVEHMDKNLELCGINPIQKSNKRVGMLLSGGIDSTMLYEYLIYRKFEVHPIYIDIKNNGSKGENELAAIEKITTKLRENYKDFDKYSSKLRTHVVSLALHGASISQKGQYGVQLMALSYMPHDIDFICLGFLESDSEVIIGPNQSFHSTIDGFRNAYYGMSGWLRNDMGITPPLILPMIDITKTFLINNLISSEGNIENDCFWCESTSRSPEKITKNDKEAKDKMNYQIVKDFVLCSPGWSSCKPCNTLRTALYNAGR